MKESEIIEGNKLIAEFMGVYSHEDRIDADVLEYELCGIIDCIEDGENEQRFFHPEKMMFHESWNWLMPVVEKIQEQFPLEGGESYGRIYCNTIEHWFLRRHKKLSKIEAVFNAVVEFIKWYNQQD